MIDWKLNRVLDQTSKIPETKRQSVRPIQTSSNGNSNLNKNVNLTIRSGTAGVPGPEVNDTARIWIQMLGKVTINSENPTNVSRLKKTNNNNNSSNTIKFDITDDFKAIKFRRLIITPKSQIRNINSLFLRNQINSLFKDEKLTIVVNTVEKSKTGQKIVLFIYYLFIKCIQPQVMTLNYFKICFYFTNTSTLYNPTIYRQFCPVFTPY